MSIITIFSASYCMGEEVARKLAEKLGYRFVSTELLDNASNEFSISRDKLESALTGSGSIFSKLLENRDRNVAYIRVAAAELARKDNLVYLGYAGLLLPRDISHILRVCLVADSDYRVKKASEKEGVSEDKAESLIKKDDEQRLNWTNYLYNAVPWDESIHDIILPMHSLNLNDALDLIIENARKDVVQTNPESKREIDDFILQSRVKLLMVEKKQDVDVAAENGKIIITLKKYVMRLEHHKEELRKLAEKVAGVDRVEFKIGPKFRMPATYPPVDLETPKKTLLVDDEVEFVQTLSERLQSRQINSSVAYDGEEALSVIEEDAPEVMVLDLKMPGIDGIEVLRRTKQDHPDTEIIILTGHGSEHERQRALELGAFAYLEKPVDIDVLAETMKKAYKKINLSKKSEDTED